MRNGDCGLRKKGIGCYGAMVLWCYGVMVLRFYGCYGFTVGVSGIRPCYSGLDPESSGVAGSVGATGRSPLPIDGYAGTIFFIKIPLWIWIYGVIFKKATERRRVFIPEI